MGASLIVVQARGTETDVRRKWADAVERDLYENGNSYSGSIGMLGPNLDVVHCDVSTFAEAEEIIADSHEKWSCGMAVEFKPGVWAIGGWCSE